MRSASAASFGVTFLDGGETYVDSNGSGPVAANIGLELGLRQAEGR